MFNNLPNFGYTRSRKEAFGFYIGWLITIMLVGAVAGVLVEALRGFPTKTFIEGFQSGVGTLVGSVVAVVFSGFICSRILYKKGMISTSMAVVYILGTLILSVLGGGVLGLIIPAYLTTRPVAGTTAGEETAIANQL